MSKKVKLIKAKPKKAQEVERQPGQVSSKLSRRMGADHAEVFNSVGKELYSAIVLTINRDLEDLFNENVTKLEETLKEELGNRGLKEAANYFAPWILEVLEDTIQFGMKDIAGKLESLASDAAAEFISEAEESGEEEPGEEDLFGVDEGVPLEEAEEVEEEEVAEPPEEPAAEEEPTPAEEGPGMPEGLEELMEGGEGEAPASAVPGPKARVWRHPKWKTKRVASGTTKRYIVKTADLVKVAGGKEVLSQNHSSSREVFDRLTSVQQRLLGKLADNYPEAQEANPNEIFDWASKHFPFKG